MCGITGIVLAPHAADPRRLAAIGAMTASLRHRGPDGDGVWIDREAGVALGHRRLAIVDLSPAGHQPMLAHGGRLVVTFNGEIYNAAGLKPELEALGHRFAGHSDTEVMLAAFESYGIAAALPRLAGMFALGVWDRRDRTLHLVRDRLGKKPLYVAPIDGALAFASELRAIRLLPGFRPALDPAAVGLLLRQGWIPDDRCIWDGVAKLAPGTILSIRADDIPGADAAWLRAHMRPWWSLAEVAARGQRHTGHSTAEDATGELDATLQLAVRERMVADVPLGALLSGGIDSATVVALMQAQSPRPVRTFTVGFAEARYDEADAAAAVARHLGTDHMALRLTPEAARAAIPDLPRIWDEPFADESQLPALLVSQLARQHVTVALSGDGGDECFAGYTRHVAAARLAWLWRLPPALRRAAALALQTLPADAWDALLRRSRLPAAVRGGLGAGHIQKLAALLAAADEGDLHARLLATGAAGCLRGGAAAPGDGAAGMPALADTASRMMYRDMAGYLPGDILVKLDRASMAVGLETRCPLLDHRVVELAWRLPTALKMRDGKGKWLLRQVLRRYVPEHLTERPKHGFDVPIGAWLRGPLRPWAEDMLATPRLAQEGLLDPVRVRACWREHLGGRRDRAGALWAILTLAAWLDAADDRPADPVAHVPAGMAAVPA